jgi:hypothetical protein
VVTASPGVAQAASGSGNTYLFTTTGGYWQIWKTYQEVSPGVYNGSWGTHSASSGVTFQKKINGGAATGADRYGSWTKKKTVYFRACNVGSSGGVINCSGWW